MKACKCNGSKPASSSSSTLLLCQGTVEELSLAWRPVRAHMHRLQACMRVRSPFASTASLKQLKQHTAFVPGHCRRAAISMASGESSHALTSSMHACVRSPFASTASTKQLKQRTAIVPGLCRRAATSMASGESPHALTSAYMHV